jgi:hypothetical protein
MALPLPKSAPTQNSSAKLVKMRASGLNACLQTLSRMSQFLVPVDNQALPEKWDAYYDWLGIDGIQLGDAHDSPSRDWVMALDRSWRPCNMQCFDRIWTDDVTIDGGMSGSPIVRDDGVAIGLISANHGPQPRLVRDLPAWLLIQCVTASAAGHAIMSARTGDD